MSGRFHLPDYPTQPIPFSMWQRIVNKSDKGEAERVLYRAWRNRPKRLIPWLSCGLKRGYVWTSHRDETENPQAVKNWIKKHLRREEVKKEFRENGDFSSMKDLIAKYKEAGE